MQLLPLSVAYRDNKQLPIGGIHCSLLQTPVCTGRNRTMSGIDPYSYMQQVARQLPELTGRRQIEEVLDELEYLFEVIPPEMQDPAEQLIQILREKLRDAQ
jgi:hypothetical protein